MQLKTSSSDYAYWRTPTYEIESFKKGFHYGKSMHVHNDSIFQEEDVFRIKLNDSTYNQINISTYGKPGDVTFDCMIFKVDSRSINRSAMECINSKEEFPEYPIRKISIVEADSVLRTWELNIRNEK